MTDFVVKTACETMVAEFKARIEKEVMLLIAKPKSLQGEIYKREWDFLKIFKDEQSSITYDIIRQMNGAIQSLVNKELKDRKLDTLPVEFLK